MNKKYTNRTEIIHRLSQPNSPSISVISEETGVPKATLYAWMRVQRLAFKAAEGNLQGVGMSKRVKARTTTVKLNMVAQSNAFKGHALSAFCAERGVTLEELLCWRDQALSGIEQSMGDEGTSPKAMGKQIETLQLDNDRKTKALAKAAELLLLQKKTSGLLEEAKLQRNYAQTL
jgi:transposase-like protein